MENQYFCWFRGIVRRIPPPPSLSRGPNRSILGTTRSLRRTPGRHERSSRPRPHALGGEYRLSLKPRSSLPAHPASVDYPGKIAGGGCKWERSRRGALSATEARERKRAVDGTPRSLSLRQSPPAPAPVPSAPGHAAPRLRLFVLPRAQHPLRWGTNDFPTIESQCHEWRDPANAEAKASNACHSLDRAIIAGNLGGSGLSKLTDGA